MKDTQLPKARRQPADKRRKSLVAAAMRCLATKGVDKTSIRTIAAEADVSIGLINHYYDGKEALIADVYEQLAGTLLQSLEQTLDDAGNTNARQRLSAFFKASFSPVNLDPELLSIWISFWSMTKSSPRVAAVHDRTYHAYLRVLEDLVAEAGHENPHLNTRLAAIGLSGLLDGLWVEWCLDPTTFSPAEGVQLCEIYLDGLLSRDRRNSV